MPRGRKKKLVDDKSPRKSSNKKDSTISKEVQDIFFDSGIKDDEVEPTVDATEDPDLELDLEAVVAGVDIEEGAEEPEIEKPESLSTTTEGEDVEQVIVISSFSDDGEERQSLQTIRKNPPPRESWADKQCKFKCGQRIMPKNLAKNKMSEYECAVVISPGTLTNSFMIKLSRSMNETSVRGNDWVEADPKCKPYVSFWEANSPVKKVK